MQFSIYSAFGNCSNFCLTHITRVFFTIYSHLVRCSLFAVFPRKQKSQELKYIYIWEIFNKGTIYNSPVIFHQKLCTFWGNSIKSFHYILIICISLLCTFPGCRSEFWILSIWSDFLLCQTSFGLASILKHCYKLFPQIVFSLLLRIKMHI